MILVSKRDTAYPALPAGLSFFHRQGWWNSKAHFVGLTNRATRRGCHDSRIAARRLHFYQYYNRH
jgi:hypothetical protein